MTTRGDRTRGAALDAAIELFSSAGWSGFTIHEVVRASGISLGSLYHHFGSMDGLAAAAYARSLSRLLGFLAGRATSKRTARESVRALVLGYLDFVSAHRAEALFIHASAYASFLPLEASSIDAEKDRALAPLVKHFGALMNEGQLRPLSPLLLETLLIGPVAEASRRWLARDPRLSLTEARRWLPEATWAAVKR